MSNPPSYTLNFDEPFDQTSLAPTYTLNFLEAFDNTSDPPSYTSSFAEPFDETSTPPTYSSSFTEPFDYNTTLPEFTSIFTEPFDYTSPPEYDLIFYEPFEQGEELVRWGALQYPKAVTKVQIGADSVFPLELTAVEYAGFRLLGAGPGGDHISVQTVLNTVPPTGVLNHSKWFEVVVALKEDEFEALLGTDIGDSLTALIMDGENAPIGYLAITQLGADGNTRTLDFESGKVYLAGINESKLTTEDGQYVIEIRFICTGGKVMYGFLEHFDYIQPPSMKPAFNEPFDEN